MLNFEGSKRAQEQVSKLHIVLIESILQKTKHKITLRHYGMRRALKCFEVLSGDEEGSFAEIGKMLTTSRLSTTRPIPFELPHRVWNCWYDDYDVESSGIGLTTEQNNKDLFFWKLAVNISCNGAQCLNAKKLEKQHNRKREQPELLMFVEIELRACGTLTVRTTPKFYKVAFIISLCLLHSKAAQPSSCYFMSGCPISQRHTFSGRQRLSRGQTLVVRSRRLRANQVIHMSMNWKWGDRSPGSLRAQLQASPQQNQQADPSVKRSWAQ